MITKRSWIFLFIWICTAFTSCFASDDAKTHEKEAKLVVITDMTDEELEDLRKKMLHAIQDTHVDSHEQKQCNMENAKHLQGEIEHHTEVLEQKAGNSEYIKVQIGKHAFVMAKALFNWSMKHLKQNALKYALKAYCYYYGYSTFTVDTAFQLIAAQNMADSITNNSATPFSFGQYLFGIMLYERAHGTE